MNKKEIDIAIEELRKELDAECERLGNLVENKSSHRRTTYGKRVRFDGDIIITDPCYIMNRDNDDRFNEKGYCNGPSWWDFVSKTTTSECEDGRGGTYTRYNPPKPEDYPDCRVKTLDDCESEADKLIAKLDMLLENHKPKMFSPTLKAEWDAYYKAQEEWSSIPHSDWERCNCGTNMEALGLKTFLVADTIYGDWSCVTENIDDNQILGEFCADAGMVGVFLLEEVLKYNPNFDYHTERPWTTTLIKGFNGTISINYDVERKEVNVVGKGNINFKTYQVGF